MTITPIQEQKLSPSEKRVHGVSVAFSLFLGLFLTLGGTKNSNFIIGCLGIFGGLSCVATGVRKSFRDEISPNDVINGVGDIVDDMIEMWSFAAKETDRVTAAIDPIIMARLPERLKAMIPPEISNQEWFDNDDFWTDSKYIFGIKRSGKSVLLAWEAYVNLRENPDMELYIIDAHLSDASPWFGGNAALVDKYCYKLSRKLEHIQTVCSVIDRVIEQFNRRVDGDETDFPLLKLIIDEFEGVIKALDKVAYSGKEFETYGEALLDIIERVQDEGAKYNSEITLGTHTIKKGRSGIDSDTTNQMHWIACGDILSSANIRIPGNIQVQELEQQRLKIAQNYVPEKFIKTAIVRINVTDRVRNAAIKAVGIPYINLEEIRFIHNDEKERENEWIEENAELINAHIERGHTSLRQISESMKLQRKNTDWRYNALKKYLQNFKDAQATDTENTETELGE